MSLENLTLPHSNFRTGDIIDAEEFNANNSAVVQKVNQLVSVANTGSTGGDDGESIFLPSYIKDTYIDPVEIKSPLITGNTLLGSNGMVGMTANGTTDTSVRIWAGASNKDIAPFRVTHSGQVTMTKATISGDFMTTNAGGRVTTSRLWHEGTVGGRLMLNTNNGGVNAVIGDASGVDGNIGGTITLHNRDVNKKRVAIGIDGEEGTDYGLINLYNTNGKATALMYAGGVVGSTKVHDGIFSLGDETGYHQVRLRGGGQSFINVPLAIGSRSPVPFNYSAQVTGNLNVVGDIYVNGVKMKLTPA